MDEEKERTSFQSRRRHERVWFKYQAVLAIAGGKTIWGVTRDVSLRGVFLHTTATPSGVEVGTTGFLRVTVLNLKKEFPCRVAHVGQDGIGIELNEQGENFGATLTASLLQETQARLGADVSLTDHIRVRFPALASANLGGVQEARMAKISLSHMEFLFSPSPAWVLKPGTELKMEIVQSRQTTIALEGVVRSVLSGENPAEKVCAVVFTVLPEQTVMAIKELVRTLHGRRLQNMMTSRSMSIGLQTGPDLPQRTRPQVRQDLERFYGARAV